MPQILPFPINDKPKNKNKNREMLDRIEKELITKLEPSIPIMDLIDLFRLIREGCEYYLKQGWEIGGKKPDQNSALDMYRMVNTASTKQIKDCMERYRKEYQSKQYMPVNLILAYIKPKNITSLAEASAIDSDLALIRKKMEMNRKDWNWLDQNISQEFTKLTLKINRNPNLDQNKKKELGKIVSESHRKALEWIRNRKGRN